MTDVHPNSLFGLLRHGKTLWNEQKRIQGSSNSPLTTEGINTLKHWQPHLERYHWNLILTSPLQRARHTAEILNKSLGLPIKTEDGLREQDWGQWEGMTLPELRKSFPRELEKQTAAGWDFTPTGGESRRVVLERSMDIVEKYHHLSLEKRILIISHQSVIKCLVYSLLNRAFLEHEKKVLNKNALHLLKHDQGRLKTHQLNIEPTQP